MTAVRVEIRYCQTVVDGETVQGFWMARVQILKHFLSFFVLTLFEVKCWLLLLVITCRMGRNTVKVGEPPGAKAYITNDKRLPIEFSVGVILSVHCACLSDIWEACQYIISGQTVGVPSKLKFIHSVITWSLGHAIAQAVIRWLPTAAAWVQTRV
jgi:hypothetical protein